MQRFAKKYPVWIVLPVIWLFFWLALNSLVGDSITMDEQNHIGRGIGFVKSGDPRLSLEHPPLVNSLAALPLLTMSNLHIPFEHPSWQKQPPDVYWYIFAEELVWFSANDVPMMTFLARLPIVFMTLGLAVVAYRFAVAFWTLPLAERPFLLLIIPLILFDPNLLAHGRYVTTDLGGTLFIFLATFLLWRLWQPVHLSWVRLGWAALGLGLAFGSKLTSFAFIPLWLGLALWPFSAKRSSQRVGWFLFAGLGSIVVVWAIFGFEWGTYFFKSAILQNLNDIQGPMPTFLAGVEQISLLSSAGRMAYLNGRFQIGGFRSYFPIAFAIKTPIMTLITFFLASFLLIWQSATRQRAIFLLIPILGYIVISMQSGLNIGYRHLLPILPFIYLLIVGLSRLGRFVGASRFKNGKTSQQANQTLFPVPHSPLPIPHSPFPIRHSPFPIPHSLLLITTLNLLLISLWIHPHYLSYFNQTIGGPKNGAMWLLDSNIDWGQDLIRLQQWMTINEVDSVKLAWFGTAVPEAYGVPNQPLPGFPRSAYYSQWSNPPFHVSHPEPGIYAISVSNLYELPLPNSGVYRWFRQRQPTDQIGYSIWIYEVD